ncbi:MAG: DUF423 domain-containing protein [Flavobacteriaceae bacterium]|nr:DUF423 domain-containing protein [Flavobacteriaceae bacterium]
MNKNLSITALLGVTAIVLGAFATHSLKENLTQEAMNSLETGIRYQMYHVIVLLFVNTFSGFTEKFKNWVSFLFFLGILLFSGSIYAIYLLGISAKSIWFVTPLGGLSFIFGWLLLFVSFGKKVINKK